MTSTINLGELLQMIGRFKSGGVGGLMRQGKEDPIAKENRATIHKLLTKAAEANNTKELEALSQSARNLGVDPSPYLAVGGIKTPLEEMQSSFETDMMSQYQTMIDDEKKAPSRSQQLFGSDFLMRSALKKMSGIDVGAHYFETDDWFADLGREVESGTPVEEAVLNIAAKRGFIPDGASNLKDLSETQKKAIFEREMSASLNDPTIDALVRKIAPKGANIEKLKVGAVLEGLASQGRYIPDHYQPFLDRFRGLEDPSFVSDEVKQHIFATTGKNLADMTPTDVAKAQKEMQDLAVVQAAREAYTKRDAALQAEFDKEILTPISAEDTAKYGIGSQFPTYEDLANAGKRFPTEADRKVYGELHSMREDLIGMKELLFGSKKEPTNGIFTGIGNDMGSRMAAKGQLGYERVIGTLRGRNYELYQDLLASFARRLLTLSGESGGRFTDRDVAQITRAMADVGQGLLGMPDSEDVAMRKYNRAVVTMGRMLERLETTTVIEPIGQPLQMGADQYIIGHVYEDADGQRARYKGDGKWEILSQSEK